MQDDSENQKKPINKWFLLGLIIIFVLIVVGFIFLAVDTKEASKSLNSSSAAPVRLLIYV